MRRAFGFVPTPRAEGFFAVAEEGEQLSYGGGLRFETVVHNDSNRLTVAGFRFHGWRALYAFHRAPQVNGALRVREWKSRAHWIRFKWRPDFEAGDHLMPALSDSELLAG